MPVPRMQRPWLWFCALYAGEVMAVAAVGFGNRALLRLLA